MVKFGMCLMMLVLFGGGGVAGAAETIDARLGECAQRHGGAEDKAARLACYDRVSAEVQRERQAGIVTHGAKAEKYRRMDIVDLKVDLYSLPGKKISSSGVIESVGNGYFFSAYRHDFNGIRAEISRLSKEKSQAIVSNCSMPPGCKATIFAHVGPTIFDLGLVLEDVEFQ